MDKELPAGDYEMQMVRKGNHRARDFHTDTVEAVCVWCGNRAAMIEAKTGITHTESSAHAASSESLLIGHNRLTIHPSISYIL